MFDGIVAPFPDVIPSIRAQLPQQKQCKRLSIYPIGLLRHRSIITLQCMQLAAFPCMDPSYAF